MISIQTWETEPLRFAADSDISMPVMVASHERSGTHFLINSIAGNSRYRNDPHLNYDFMPLGSFHNFHDKAAVARFFERVALTNCASVIKSHFAAPFFLGDDQRLLTGGLCKIIYILRNPIEVMISYHRLIQHFAWHEGPKPKRVVDFPTAAPEGRMLRYQTGQIPTIIERWKEHLIGWLDLAAAHPDDVLVVNYGDLNSDHAGETERVLAFIGCEAPNAIVRPSRFVRTVQVPPGPAPSPEETGQIHAAILDKIGDCERIARLFPALFANAAAPRRAVAG